MNPFRLVLLNPWVILGFVAALAGASVVGDRYGLNAWNYAECKGEAHRRNSAIKTVNSDETEKHKAEEIRRAKLAKEFSICPNIQSCPLTKETAACLELLQ